MQRLEVSSAVRLIYRSLGFKGLIDIVVFDYIPFPVLTHTTGMTPFQDSTTDITYFSLIFRRPANRYSINVNFNKLGNICSV